MGLPAPTLRQIALSLPEPQRTRLSGQAERLREMMERVQRESGTVRAATRSLLAHMEGLMRQVARSLSHAGTYGSGGRVQAAHAVVSSLDVRS